MEEPSGANRQIADHSVQANEVGQFARSHRQRRIQMLLVGIRLRISRRLPDPELPIEFEPNLDRGVRTVLL